ncbi:MAG: DNA polymerase I [Candidatus Abyssobacteria bacterium SURF_17]|uniref:DNA polymerase I n=1 Tax=Candidatus Abyssobacteria bacterium SURF_17 TaxID=2093361 RepID=A0A419F814_9BACT|nr:MAG: DNA polymerase I [Candidatus Abyssubacteria bacterium SURF_17]
MTEAKKKIYLIDGHSYAYRAFHAIRQLTDSSGLALNAVYGFTRMLLKLMKDEQPGYIAVAFDTPGKTFRHEMYEEYKANRAEQPEEMRHQIPLIKEVVEAFNIRTFELAGYEADDVLATLAKKAADEGIEAVIVTGDKDMLQLVSDNIKVLNPHKENLLYDAEAVKQRFGVGPEQMRDLLGMAGDPTDNVPGVPGIGPKTAAELLNEYRTIENIFEHVDEIKGPKRRENLRQNKDLALLSRELVSIVSDVPLEIDLEACKTREYDSEKLAEVFKRLEFRSLISEVAETHQAKDAEYLVIDKERELDALLKRVRQAGSLSIDFETTSTDPMRAKLVGISIALEPRLAHYIPVGHSVSPADDAHKDEKDDLFAQAPPPQLNCKLVLDRLGPVLEDEAIKKTGQNIKYEMVILARNGIELSGVDFDTMVASYLLNPSKQSHNLDQLALEFLNYRKIPIDKLIGKGAGQKTMDAVDINEVAEYCCEDADITLRLRNVLEPMLKEKGLYELFEKVELPLMKVLAKMERAGVRVDVGVFRDLSERLAKQLGELEQQIHALAGCKFNINSTQQLGKILFEEMNLPYGRKTKTGYSTDMAVLEKLAVEHELPKSVLEYRTLSKLKSTYIDALPSLVNPETGRIHTSFNQTITATGRLSSSEPNLQNIPIRSELGREIRRAFVPSDNRSVLMSADYSQIELRILAHLSGDEELSRAFNEGLDVHDQTSSKMFRVPIDQVTLEMRRKAKVANYGILYGISAARLAADVGIKLEEAKGFIENYFTIFPRVKGYLDSMVEEARRVGYVTTIMNRRRYIPDINSQNYGVRGFAERTAINTPIQGSAADLIKMAMIQIDERLAAMSLRSKMILQVHDELVFEVPLEDLEKTKQMVKETMETAYPLSVPIVADVRIGRNWLEAHD